MAHFSGFVATEQLKSPFDYCDVVTSTTHKTLRGPRSGIIFSKKKYENLINESVFPSLQGGPHENVIAAIAAQMKEINTEFKNYIIQVKKNAKYLCNFLKEKNYTICGVDTENHIILIDLKNKNITGSKIEYICEKVNISINKNSVPGDKSALSPGGIRIGTSAITTRGFIEEDIRFVADILDETINLAIKVQDKSSSLKLKDFKEKLEMEKFNKEINKIRTKVILFSEKFIKVPSIL
jgi:glycine hydroxymethyltransferase